MMVVFNFDTFLAGFSGTASNEIEWSSILLQVKSIMLVTVWIFTGIEGAVVFSSRAKRKRCRNSDRDRPYFRTHYLLF